MSLEKPITEDERAKLREILTDPKKLDDVIDRAIKSWRRGRSWRRKTKKS